MKIQANLKPELACSTDKTRNHLTECWLDKASGKLVATNGYIIASVPVTTDEHDSEGYISKDALKAARAETKITKKDEAALTASENTLTANGIGYPRPKHGVFPPYREVVPNGEDHTVTIGIDANLLWQLAQAIGADKTHAIVKLQIKLTDRDDGPQTTLDPILVTSNNVASRDCLGVIMPCRV